MITQKQVKELFHYDRNSGCLIYKKPTSRCVSAGDNAGWVTNLGYLRVMINNKNYSVHRVIYLWNYGLYPAAIDHVDNNKSNNRLVNLRSCTPAQNQQNKKIQRNNSSGYKNICWSKRNRKWKATLQNKGIPIHFGYFDDIDVAAQLLRIERINLHKEFANHG